MWIVLEMDENYHMHPIDHIDKNQSTWIRLARGNLKLIDEIDFICNW